MKKILILIILTIAISSCGTERTQTANIQIPPTTKPSQPTYTSAPPTATPQPTSTPVPPTATSEPTDKPTETPIPSMTPTLPPLGEEGNPIVWAIYPETDLNVFIPAAEQAAKIMTDRTGLIVETKVVDNFPQIVDMLCSGEAQIGALNAFGYLLAQERGCTSIVLTAELFGGSAYQGQILVRSDSGITGIADLAGNTFCRRAVDSRSTWIIPRLMMLAAGIDPDNDFKEIIDTENIPNTISGIYNGTCDAGATYVDARIDHREEFPDIFNVIHVLAQTIQIPNNGVTFSPNLPNEIQEKLEDVFYYLEIFEGGNVLKDLYGWDGIFERGDYLYDPLREVINASGVELESLIQD
jgi:phosphonate transport system substrate-binding protein